MRARRLLSTTGQRHAERIPSYREERPVESAQPQGFKIVPRKVHAALEGFTLSSAHIPFTPLKPRTTITRADHERVVGQIHSLECIDDGTRARIKVCDHIAVQPRIPLPPLRVRRMQRDVRKRVRPVEKDGAVFLAFDERNGFVGLALGALGLVHRIFVNRIIVAKRGVPADPCRSCSARRKACLLGSTLRTPQECLFRDVAPQYEMRRILVSPRRMRALAA